MIDTTVISGADPSTPAEAATRLDQLKADPAWTKALMSGGPVQTRTFHELHELVAKGDTIDLAMSGVMPDSIVQDSGMVEMRAAAAMWRERGIPDAVIRDNLSGKTVTPRELYDATARWKKDAMSDPEWVKKLMSGNSEARLQYDSANFVLTGGIKEQA